MRFVFFIVLYVYSFGASFGVAFAVRSTRVNRFNFNSNPSEELSSARQRLETLEDEMALIEALEARNEAQVDSFVSTEVINTSIFWLWALA